MQPSYNYQQVLTNSERVNWRVEDIIGGNRIPHLTFNLPDSSGYMCFYFNGHSSYLQWKNSYNQLNLI